MSTSTNTNGRAPYPTQNGAFNKHAPSNGSREGIERLREKLVLFWREKWIMLTVVVLVMGGAAFYTLSLPPEYEASTLLLIQKEQSAVPQEFMVGVEDRTLQNQILVIQQSEDLVRRVAGSMLSHREASSGQKEHSIFYGAEGRPLTEQQLAGRIGGHMRASLAGRDVDAIRIVGVSSVAEEAALIANTYAEEYIAWTLNQSRANIKNSRVFLEEQENKLQAELMQLENRIREYKSRTGTTALDRDASRLVQQIAGLQAMRDQSRIELDMQEAIMRTQKESLEDITGKLVERAVSDTERDLRSVQQEIFDLELRIESIHRENPRLNEDTEANAVLRSEINEMQQRLNRLRERSRALSEVFVDEVLASGGIDPLGAKGGNEGLGYIIEQRRSIAQQEIAISGLRAQIGTLNQRLANYQERLGSIPAQSIELARMERARLAAEQLYSFIVRRLQEARIAEQSKLGYADILRHAHTPGGPVRPDTQRNLMLALFFGLLMGCGLVLLREKLDTRLRTPTDLRAHGYAVQGIIRDMEPFVKQEFEGKKFLTVDKRTFTTDLPMLLAPLSVHADAYRRVRTNIQFSRPDIVVKSLLVTSAGQGEGKSTTAANLALAMAQANRRTILLDADFRRPQVHQKLGVNRSPGLTELLFEDIENLNFSNYRTLMDNLSIITAGSEAPSPTELIGSKKMRDLLRVLREEYDVVIIDTPPLLAFTDAQLLSSQCDATLLVALAGKTDERAYAHAREMLNDVGAHCIGGLLNRFDAKHASYGYDYGYGYANGAEKYYDAPAKGKKRKRLTDWVN